MTAGELARRLAVLEARRGGPQAPAFPDGIAVAAIGDLAVDVLEAVVSGMAGDHLPAGLCAGVRPAAGRAVRALGMALGKFWPEASGDPLQVMAGLTRGLVPGIAGDHAAVCR